MTPETIKIRNNQGNFENLVLSKINGGTGSSKPSDMFYLRSMSFPIINYMSLPYRQNWIEFEENIALNGYKAISIAGVSNHHAVMNLYRAYIDINTQKIKLGESTTTILDKFTDNIIYVTILYVKDN